LKVCLKGDDYVDLGLFIGFAYITIGVILGSIYSIRLIKNGIKVQKKTIRFGTLYGSSIGLVLSIIVQASLQLSLFLIILFGLFSYIQITFQFRLRKLFRNEDK
jgi:hypothetical protein